MSTRATATLLLALIACGDDAQRRAPRLGSNNPVWKTMASAITLSRQVCEDPAVVAAGMPMMSSWSEPALAGDTDRDGLTDEQERRMCTLPDDDDSDGDGLLDGWEVRGVNNLRLHGASPRHRDIFVRMDAMDGLAPSAQLIADLAAVYAAAPVDNLDGSRGIALHLERGNEQLERVAWGHDHVARFFAAKAAHGHDAVPVFHYMIWAHSMVDGSSGRAIEGVGGPDFVVTLGSLSNGGSHQQRLGTFLHELGHTLALRHCGPGAHDRLTSCPHQLSVMNHRLQVTGVVRDRGVVFTYQEVATGALDERRLEERVGIGVSAELRRYHALWAPRWTFERAGGPLNWDGDPDEVYQSNVRWDLNGDGVHELLPAIPIEWRILDLTSTRTIGSRANPAQLAAALRRRAEDNLKRMPDTLPAEELTVTEAVLFEAMAQLQMLAL